MKRIFGEGMKLFGRTVMVLFISVFVCVFVSGLCTALFTEEIGYEVYGSKEDEQDAVALYTHYNKDGEDTQRQVYEDAGYSLRRVAIRSDLGKTGKAFYLTAVQVITLLMLIAFVYPPLWRLGASDRNAVDIGRQKEDRPAGLKIGLASQIPDLLLWGMLAVLTWVRAETPLSVYRLVHCQYFSCVQAILGEAKVAGDLSVMQLLLLLLPLMIVPLIAFAGYTCGRRDISVGEKLLYKSSRKQEK